MHHQQTTIGTSTSLTAVTARALQRQHWATLPLRQQWADEAFMRAHIRAAGLYSPERNEPATARRLALLLLRAGVSSKEVVQAVGPEWRHEDGRPLGKDAVLSCFLALNPDLPLWAAVAIVLELTGRFTPAAGMHLH